MHTHTHTHKHTKGLGFTIRRLNFGVCEQMKARERRRESERVADVGVSCLQTLAFVSCVYRHLHSFLVCIDTCVRVLCVFRSWLVCIDTCVHTDAAPSWRVHVCVRESACVGGGLGGGG